MSGAFLIEVENGHWCVYSQMTCQACSEPWPCAVIQAARQADTKSAKANRGEGKT